MLATGPTPVPSARKAAPVGRVPLFRQGYLLCGLIPNMAKHRLQRGNVHYAELLSENSAFTEIFGLV